MTKTRLNGGQQAAVEMRGGTLVTTAGAGSGKTHMLVHRIMRDHEADETKRQIVVTFTNKAGQELRERLESAGAWMPEHVGTLHSWALSRLPAKDQRIIGDREYEKLIRATLDGIGKKRVSIAEGREMAMSSTGTAGNKLVIAIAIQRAMQGKNLLHPDLMLSIYAQQLTDLTSDDMSNAIVYVDEFQDTASIDATIYRRMQDHGAGLFVVGDIRQAIFGFRGASWAHMAKLIERADDRAELTLNYRSGSAIIGLANRIEKRLETGIDLQPIKAATDQAGRIERTTYESAEAEALRIHEWAADRVGSVAVLARYNASVEMIAGVLRAHGLNVEASTDHEDLHANLADDEGLVEWARIQPEGRDESWWKDAMAARGCTLEAQDALAGMLSRAVSADERVAILSNREAKQATGTVYVGTVHSAKGLEWDGVWLAGCDAEAYRPGEQADVCLAYVAVTRARHDLRISSAASRQAHARLTSLQPSELLFQS